MFTILVHLDDEQEPVALPGFASWIHAAILAKLLRVSLNVRHTTVADNESSLPFQETDSCSSD
jgi:hypothetical protein